MRKMQRSLFLTLGGLVVGIGLGLLVSLVFFSPTDSQSETTLSVETRLPSPKSDFDNENLSSVPIDLVAILELDTASARRLALYEQIENKTGLQIAELLSRSLPLDSSEQFFFVQSLLFSELVHVDPESALELVWETAPAKRADFLDIVMEEWASIEPQRAMASASVLTEPWKSFAFRTILQTRQDDSPEKLIDLAESFGASAVLSDISISTQLEEVIDEPKTAYGLVLNSNLPAFRKNQMIALITDQWIEREGTNNFGTMFGEVYDLFTEEQYQWRMVVSKISKPDPKEAWEQLLTLPLNVQKMLNEPVFEVWVEQDPFDAINALTETGYMTSEEWELPVLYWKWARAVSDHLLENISLIPVDHRPNALRQVIRLKAEHLPPEEVLEFINQFSALGISTKDATDELLRIWSRADPSAAIEWIEENFEEGSWERNWKMRDVLIQLARQDVTKAMEIALQQPVESGAEYTVIGVLLQQNKLDQGLSLLPSVREGARASVYSYTAGYLIAAGRLPEAINLAEEFTEEEKFSFYEGLVTNMSFLVDGDDRIAIVREIDDKKLRSRLSASILRTDGFRMTLTDSERELLSSFVQEGTN